MLSLDEATTEIDDSEQKHKESNKQLDLLEKAQDVKSFRNNLVKELTRARASVLDSLHVELTYQQMIDRIAEARTLKTTIETIEKYGS